MPLSLAIPTQNHLITIFEKPPHLTIRKVQWFRSPPRDLEQAAK
jgi:hypothetical protein